MSLAEAISEARAAGHLEYGKCAMCAVGDIPYYGLHQGAFRCGNEDTCLLCHNSGMEPGDQCSGCGRIQMPRKAAKRAAKTKEGAE